MNTQSTTKSRRLTTLAFRLAAGVGFGVTALALVGGSAQAGSDEPIIPAIPVELIPAPFEPLPAPHDLDLIPIPDPPDPTIPPPDLPDPELTPTCTEWSAADMSVSSVDNGDLTATVTLAYADPTGICNELFIVHSVREDAAMNPLGLLAEEHVTMLDLQLDGDHSVSVDVPLDPCYTRVFTHAPEAVLLQDDHYGDGCPPEDTIPEDTIPEDTIPEDTIPDDTVPTPTVPDGTLPMTGSSTTVVALLGGALVLAGGTLALGVRRSQLDNRG